MSDEKKKLNKSAKRSRRNSDALLIYAVKISDLKSLFIL